MYGAAWWKVQSDATVDSDDQTDFRRERPLNGWDSDLDALTVALMVKKPTRYPRSAAKAH